MRSGQVIGAEALIRWQHPKKGLLEPALFLPSIEDHTLAVEIGEWVIDAALGQMERWRAAGLSIPVSVNVGARQLQHADFVLRLRTLLAAYPHVNPCDLELEVLETSALQDLAHISQIMEACGQIGVRFALDDFGTGYSSLTYLKRLPVAVLKIDQSFVRDMLDDPDDLAILEGVLGLASAFHRQPIAEGVETVGHGEMLLRLGCELAQGYGIARPMPANDLPEWMATWRPAQSWLNLASVSRDDLPLLFASVEHRAWIVTVEAFLKGECEALPLNHQQCRFGTWLNAAHSTAYALQPAFQLIEPLHQQVHNLVTQLLELQAKGRSPEALARLGEVHNLRDVLLEALNTLGQQSR
jgi:EAL domain-containing protein (putative c-di-GMP-specific phosphodiesterase class I)